MRVWLIVAFVLVQLPALGQFTEEPDEDMPEPRRSRLAVLQEKALQLIETTQELSNWDEHYGYMVDAMERMYEHNGWNAESDLFSLEMAREIGSIPPWEPQARIDMLMEMAGDRYLLDDDQAASLQGHIFRVNVDLFSKHADRIIEYATEAIQTRAAGEPFTPEQVARWVELAEPVMNDARHSIRETAKVFGEELDPEQRELMMRDLAAADGRMLDMDRMAQSWKRGEWQPRDWGLEEDPIQMQGAPPPAGTPPKPPSGRDEQPAEEVEPAPGETSGSNPRRDERATTPSDPIPDDEWARYVRAFIRKYHLNNEQQQRAWLIYHDAKGRDDVFERRFQRQMDTLRTKAGESKNERAQAALRERTERHQLERKRLFNQLKRRLERLPTRAQRKNALPDEIDTPEPTTKNGAPPKKPSEKP